MWDSASDMSAVGFEASEFKSISTCGSGMSVPAEFCGRGDCGGDMEWAPDMDGNNHEVDWRGWREGGGEE